MLDLYGEGPEKEEREGGSIKRKAEEEREEEAPVEDGEEERDLDEEVRHDDLLVN